jgi:hypothetical protein
MADLKHISALALKQRELEEEVANIEATLKDAKERLRAVAEGELPQAMEDAEMESFTLDDGSKVTVKLDHHPSIKDKPSVFAWMRSKGFGALIKNTVSIAFGKGEEELASQAVARLVSLFPDHGIEREEGVHPSTLKAFVKESLEEGRMLPDGLDIFTRKVAKVELPKAKKGKAAAGSGSALDALNRLPNAPAAAPATPRERTTITPVKDGQY